MTFLAGIRTLRDRARRRMREAAAASGVKAVVNVLNEALAAEIVRVLRYKRHQLAAKGIHGRGVAAEFAEHAADEQGHADLIAQRIVELGGEPDYSPACLVLSGRPERAEVGDLPEMIEEDLVAERVGIECCGEIVRYLGEDDPGTRRLFEGILAKEEGHAEDLSSLLRGLGRKSREFSPRRAAAA